MRNKRLEKQLEEKRTFLKEKGVVLTTPRLIILEYLLKNQIHPTAEDIYNALKKRFPSLSQASIYNTLKLFTKLGVVTELTIEKEKTRYDINTTPMPILSALSAERYMICLMCLYRRQKKYADIRCLQPSFIFMGFVRNAIRIKLNALALHQSSFLHTPPPNHYNAQVV